MDIRQTVGCVCKRDVCISTLVASGLPCGLSLICSSLAFLGQVISNGLRLEGKSFSTEMEDSTKPAGELARSYQPTQPQQGAL